MVIPSGPRHKITNYSDKPLVFL
ncbi:MAG: hypothetical protein ACAI35_07110 [Candidatus Methylacidiphilales bacterium]